jgi:hypothetical protein
LANRPRREGARATASKIPVILAVLDGNLVCSYHVYYWHSFNNHPNYGCKSLEYSQNFRSITLSGLPYLMKNPHFDAVALGRSEPLISPISGVGNTAWTIFREAPSIPGDKPEIGPSGQRQICRPRVHRRILPQTLLLLFPSDRAASNPGVMYSVCSGSTLSLFPTDRVASNLTPPTHQKIEDPPTR